MTELVGNSKQSLTELPFILAGPLLRKVSLDQVVVWLVTSAPLEATFNFYQDDHLLASVDSASICHSVRVGKSAYIHLLNYQPEQPLSAPCWYQYDLNCAVADRHYGLKELVPHLVYPGAERPKFAFKDQLDQVLHGSCRKPHYKSDDALLRVDQTLARSQTDLAQRPALLMMSGDQIYADDVAGPMLTAIHQVINVLGLDAELVEGAVVKNSAELYQSPHCYYEREELLPKTKVDIALRERFFGGAEKPIFTADTAHNHLITLAEVLAMYFLVWSPTLWRYVSYSAEQIPDQYLDLYLAEARQIDHFSKHLDKVQRALAHIPVYMIFDDHDITDDWNLTRGWEEAASSHPFSRSIIGNTLLGYWLCQGWGNAPEKFPQDWQQRLELNALDNQGRDRNELITDLFEFANWGYVLETHPKMVVLDTRTQRWWSESSAIKPSGLMDWEALSELQQSLIGEESVLLISPAPIFGMKLIETVQKVFTYFGHALMVDAENWMAHRGSANVILNIFSHPKTPQNFVILSGDVHYSFMYDIKIRFRKNSPDIWQITCSGIKNEFPERLITLFDKLNRWLYGSRSPLNWFTKRRRMQIRARKPAGLPKQRMLNASGIGLLKLNASGEPTQVSVLTAKGADIDFVPTKKGED